MMVYAEIHGIVELIRVQKIKPSLSHKTQINNYVSVLIRILLTGGHYDGTTELDCVIKLPFPVAYTL